MLLWFLRARASADQGRGMPAADRRQTPSPNCAAVSDAPSGLAIFALTGKASDAAASTRRPPSPPKGLGQLKVALGHHALS